MNRFLLGGWAARPIAFLFLRRRWFLVLFCLTWSPVFCSVFRYRFALLRLTVLSDSFPVVIA